MATKRSGSSDNPEAAASGAAKKSRGAGGAAKKTTAGAAKKTTTGAAKKSARKTTGAGKTAGARGSRERDLRSDLRDFAAARPQGWNHEDWMAFLEDLRNRGHNIEDREAIGRALERERLDLKLENVPGLGPQKRKALVERFDTVWSLRNADVDEIASVAKVNRSVAEDVKGSLQ